MFKTAAISANGNLVLSVVPGQVYLLEICGSFGGGNVDVFFTGAGGPSQDIPNAADISTNHSTEICTASPQVKLTLSGATGALLIVSLAPKRF